MRVFPLYEGSYLVDYTKAFIPFDAAIDLVTKGSLYVHIYPFLIETANDLILLDAGLGKMDASEPAIYRSIRLAGFQPDQISKIIMSHLHKDHSLGLVRKEKGSFVLNFPTAELYVQKKEMQVATLATGSSYPAEEMRFVSENASLTLLDGNGKIGNETFYELSGGHSPFHQVIQIGVGAGSYFFGGDEMPETSSLTHNYIAKYDFDGRRAKALRTAYGTTAALERQICLFYHDHHGRPASRVSYVDGLFLTPGL